MAAKSWLPIPSGSHFSLANIPFGIISTSGNPSPRPAVAIGDYVLDLGVYAAGDGFSNMPSLPLEVFSQPTLNHFAALGRSFHWKVRKHLQMVFMENTLESHTLQGNARLKEESLIPRQLVTMHLPLHIGDYTDFYAGRNHAYNVGVLFRGASNALQPNYTHLPVGYHGRASSVVVSGTPIRRPWGQILENPAVNPKIPIFAPCRRLDFELELGAFVCKANKMGEHVPISNAEDSLFGVVLLNDWSARDIQAYEYVPLGPFNGKNFGTSISSWVVLADALEPFRCKGLVNETEILPYLQEQKEENMYDLNLEVDITTPSGSTTTITRTTSSNLLFSFPQMLAHHSITGCPMQVGDLLGTGTISGVGPGSQGSMLEQCWNGKSSIKLGGGEERLFLEDGDTVTMRGWAAGEDGSIVGFGECMGCIEPANKW